MPSTTPYRRGDIVLVSFPFTDLTSSKRRPALVISPDSFHERGEDLVLAAITSQEPDDKAAAIAPSDCVEGTLPKASYVKVGKIFTIHSTLVLKRICTLRQERLVDVLQHFAQLLFVSRRLHVLGSPAASKMGHRILPNGRAFQHRSALTVLMLTGDEVMTIHRQRVLGCS